MGIRGESSSAAVVKCPPPTQQRLRCALEAALTRSPSQALENSPQRHHLFWKGAPAPSWGDRQL